MGGLICSSTWTCWSPPRQSSAFFKEKGQSTSSAVIVSTSSATGIWMPILRKKKLARKTTLKWRKERRKGTRKLRPNRIMKARKGRLRKTLKVPEDSQYNHNFLCNILIEK